MDAVTRKTLRRALYTSPVIAVPSISPILMKFEVPPHIIFYAFVVQAIMVFILWLVNIWLFNNPSSKLPEKHATIRRMVVSYVFALCSFIALREISYWWIINIGFVETLEDKVLKWEFPYYMVVLSFSINTVILMMQDLIYIRSKKDKADMENSRLKLKNAEIANMELKNQLHPHFLFNALNTLKNLIRKEPLQAEEYLIKLSNFLRVSISAYKTNTVQLQDELKLCEDYLQMQRTRFGDTLQYEFDIPAEISTKGMVPIFAIQLLLENIIKHNAMYKSAPLKIQMKYDEDADRVVVTNNIQKRETKEVSTGMGLENLSERYQLLSGDAVIIKEDENKFSVSIKVLSDESSNHRG